MTKFLKATAFILPALMISTTTLAAHHDKKSMATIQTKEFTRDQLAEALDTVVTHINKCDGDTSCLKGVKEWNGSAMTQVKSASTTYANKKLTLKIICGKKITDKTVTTDAQGQFKIPSNGLCLIKGDNPKCGALAKGKKYPSAKNGSTLYCITGDDTKLKATTTSLKDAIIAAMKKAVTNKMKNGAAKTTTPAAKQ